MLGSSRFFSSSGFYTYKSQVSRAVIKFLRKHQYMTRPTSTAARVQQELVVYSIQNKSGNSQHLYKEATTTVLRKQNQSWVRQMLSKKSAEKIQEEMTEH